MTSLFLPYGSAPTPELLKGVRVVGTNMSRPPWAALIPEGVKLITTVDVPQAKMQRITPTVEHAWGLIMAAHRRLPAAAADAYGDRDSWIAPWSLSGRTLGVVGYGRIGERAANVARCFGMRVDWYDPRVPGGAGCAPMLGRSNVVLVSCTLNETSAGLLRGKLHLMRPDAILVSIAPWEILDPIEVVSALANNNLRAAAFDDWPSGYSSTTIAQLRREGRLIITPHIGGSTLDARAATEQFVREEMVAWQRNPA